MDESSDSSTRVDVTLQQSQQHPRFNDAIGPLPSLQNLVDVYHALIQASLMPLTALELHHLIRLLTESPQSSRKVDKASLDVVFAPIF